MKISRLYDEIKRIGKCHTGFEFLGFVLGFTVDFTIFNKTLCYDILPNVKC